MCIKKRNKEIKVFKLSDDAVYFIKTYLLKEFTVTSPIDMDILDDFVSIAFNWETEMVDENGNDKNYSYPNKERNEMADRFVSEVSGKLSTNMYTPDFDDLNERLGLM